MKTSTEIINIAGFTIELRRKKIKTLRLAVHPPQGRVTFSVPYRLAKRDVQRFIEERIEWLHAQQEYIQTQSYRPKPEYISGSTIYVWGRACILQIVDHGGRPRIEFGEDGSACLFISEQADVIAREKVIHNWYRQQLKGIMPELLEKWQAIIGKNADDWGIKKMKTRWGSCNIQAKRIWINLDLAMWPPSCLEYVVVHELTHLHERYHNARFKSLLDNFFPDWRMQEKILKDGIEACT